MLSLTDSEKDYLLELVKDDPPVFGKDIRDNKIPSFKVLTEAQKFNLLLKLNQRD